MYSVVDPLDCRNFKWNAKQTKVLRPKVTMYTIHMKRLKFFFKMFKKK
jgi:hypothetical protein